MSAVIQGLVKGEYRLRGTARRLIINTLYVLAVDKHIQYIINTLLQFLESSLASNEVFCPL